jgi:hypothetical protein
MLVACCAVCPLLGAVVGAGLYLTHRHRTVVDAAAQHAAWQATAAALPFTIETPWSKP